MVELELAPGQGETKRVWVNPAYIIFVREEEPGVTLVIFSVPGDEEALSFLVVGEPKVIADRLAGGLNRPLVN